MYCRKCGKEISEKVRYCNYCGVAVGVNGNSDNCKRKKNRKILIVAFCSLLILSLVAGVGIRRQVFERNIRNAIDKAWKDGSTDDVPVFLQEIDKKSAYEIVSIVKGDIYTINVVVKGIDLRREMNSRLFEDFLSLMDDDVWDNYICELIEKCEYVETETIIYVTPLENEYNVFFSDTFVDAMSGKIYSYCMDVIDEIMGGVQ